MEGIIGLFNALFLIPLINLLVFLFKLLELINFPGSLGFAIILLTIIIRLLIWPLTHTQLKSTQKMVELKPLLDELKIKHKDKMELQKAQMALYKEHGVNPTAGCLPTLLQLPILIALYQAIINMFGDLRWVNSILYNSWLHLSNNPESNFIGLDLSTNPASFQSSGVILLAVPVVTVVLTFMQSKMMLPSKVRHYGSDSPKETVEKEGIEDAMASIQGQMVYLMPIMIGYFSFQFPIGLAVYWNTLTIIGIIQQYQISGWGGMVNIFNRVGIKMNSKKINTTKVTIERK